MAFIQSSIPKSDPQTTSTSAPTGKVGNKVAPTVPLDWDSAPPFRYKPTIPRKASKPIDKPRNEILEIPDPDSNASLWEELGFGLLDESDTSSDNIACTESQQEAPPSHKPQIWRDARSHNPSFRYPPGFQPQEAPNAPDIQANPSKLQDGGDGQDHSSPIVIPDNHDGESSANHGDTRPEEPDHSTSIDPTQDHPSLASQLLVAVDESLEKTSAGERGSSECHINRVHHRTTGGAVDITSLAEAAQSNNQPAKPDRYDFGYGRGRKGLVRKYNPQKRTASSSPEIPGNVRDTLSRKRRKLSRPRIASPDKNGGDITEAFSSDNDIYGRFRLSNTKQRRQQHKQASRINWNVPGFRTPSDDETTDKTKAKRPRRVRFEEDDAFLITHKPEVISSPQAATGSPPDNERVQDIGYTTDSSATEADISTAGADAHALCMRPNDGSIIKTENHDTDYEILDLHGKVVEGGRSYYWTQWARTLEPEENLPSKLVAEYEARQKSEAMVRPGEQKRRGRPRKQINLGRQL